MTQDFNIENYNYQLPEERIAKFPLAERSKSKLLVWKNGDISHHIFDQSPSLIPPDSLLVFNDTKVIAARLILQKPTGARIELFLLHPELPTRDIASSMQQKESSIWTCMIGNKKKWKDGKLIVKVGDFSLSATYHNRELNQIHFEWSGGKSFAEVINKIGVTPLPPYLKRKANKQDSISYQTVYSKNDGAVAAPTAGLHFTDDILSQIRANHGSLEYLTLHVSAGTFKPVEADDYRDHEMHNEQIIIKIESLKNLLQHHNCLIAVGTTSFRILESLYWYGVLLSVDKEANFFIPKNLPSNTKLQKTLTFKDALIEIIQYLDRNNLSEIRGETEIFIYPGYEIKTARGLFTNFHLPKSTLLLLVSTFTNSSWKKIYKEALSHNYRFLSYGDSSLLLR